MNNCQGCRYFRSFPFDDGNSCNLTGYALDDDPKGCIHYDAYKYDDEDSFNNEVEIQASTLVENLRTAIRHEYESEIRRLETELETLKHYRDEKDLFDKTVSTLKWKVQMLEKEIEQRAKQLRLNEFIEFAYKPCYVVSSSTDYMYEKCDKCDENRFIHFKSPSGKELTENCKCAERKFTYYVEEARLVKFIEDDKRPEQEFPGVYVEFLVDHDLVKFDRHMLSDLHTYRIFYNGKEKLEDMDSWDLSNQYYRNNEDAEEAVKVLTSRLGKGEN